MQDVPYGFCHCGCGERTPISPYSHAAMGYVRGEPRRFKRGHANKINAPADVRARSGICECGCGHAAPIAEYTNPGDRIFKGYPLRFIKGHNARKPEHYRIEDRGYTTPCWVWQLALNAQGYALHTASKTAIQHRAYYEQFVGPIPEGLHLDHLCRVRACVNPDHLEPVTAMENARRGDGTKLNVEAVAEIRRRYAAGGVLQRELAAEFGVAPSRISMIVNCKDWK